MYEKQLEPGQSGWGDPASQHCGETPNKEERRQAGPQATLEGNIDNAIDETNSTVNGRHAQGFAVRWLISRYPISAAFAAIIANELGMECASRRTMK
jgi:hypothetical protein